MAFTFSRAPLHHCSPKRRRTKLTCSLEQPTHIAACIGPTCKKSNSANVVLTLQELSRDLDGITVEAVGCLGECGNGPNVGITCRGTTPRIQTGVSTLRDVADLLHSLGHDPCKEVLEALEKKERGDELLSTGDASGAVVAYDVAVTMLTTRPRLLARVLCNRSAAFREKGLGEEALRDANEAAGIEPGLAGAWKRKAEAHQKLKDVEMAVQSWTMWGRLAGKSEEASQIVSKLRGWRFAIFGD